MNAKQWRAAGYAVLFDNGLVVVVDKQSGLTARAEIHGGAWMNEDDLSREPWEILPNGLGSLLQEDRFRARMAACYCASLPGSTCDSCSGVRPAPAEPDEQDTMEQLARRSYPRRRQDGQLAMYEATNGAVLVIDTTTLTWAMYGGDGLMVGYDRGFRTLRARLEGNSQGAAQPLPS